MIALPILIILSPRRLFAGQMLIQSIVRYQTKAVMISILICQRLMHVQSLIPGHLKMAVLYNSIYMEYLKTNLKGIALLSLLILGITVGLYLVSHPKIFKSKADAAGLIITSSDGSTVNYQGNNSFQTTSDNVQIGIQNLDKLK